MKVDYAKFPEIPPGCSQNYNKKTKLYQVYRERRERDSETKQIRIKRDTIGSIRDGVFRFGENYRLREENKRLIQENTLYKEKLERAEAFQSLDKGIEANAKAVCRHIGQAVEESKLDSRKYKSALIPVKALATAALLTVLTGPTDAVLIQDHLMQNKAFFKAYMPELVLENLSHDTVRRVLLLARTDSMESFFTKLTAPMVQELSGRILNVDGQAVRGSGRKSADNPEKHGVQLMLNVFDSYNRACLASKIIPKKTNEMTVGPHLLEKLNIDGCIVTADAMNCQVRFVETVLGKGADYLLSLKGNQDRTLKEIMYQFSTAHESNLSTYTTEPELDHGRIEQREISILAGRFLSKELYMKWRGLAGGCVVRISKSTTEKKTGVTTREVSYFISSLCPETESAESIYEALRSHWNVENNLHYMLDMLWRQDQMRACNPRYISNCSMLNKLALTLLENYRFWLWNTGRIESPEQISIRTLQSRCQDPKVALECLAVGFGLTPKAL